LNYRREIDGLRALAVIPVILFHAGFEWFSGGYIGVDVFFVISGYLITSIIIIEKEAKTFTFTHFYERRARRILPALFFVLFICLPFAWFWLLPNELEEFGEGLVAVTLFASNILFWLKTDYFATDAEFIPLLHTWSLAVEEQFYIFFPLLLTALWALGKRWLIAIIIFIALVSLAFSEGLWRYAAEANFYLLISRAWELMIGTLIAFYLYQNPQQPQHDKLAQIASTLGLLLILYAIFFFDKTIPFPSLYALVPTVGTAFIILFATPYTLVGKLLSLPPFVGIGLISYSAYLWHQPIFSFVRIHHLDPPSPFLLASLSVLSLTLAYLSWRFIEQPFRNKQRFNQRKIFLLAIIGSLLFISIGFWFIMSKGAMYRFE
jgi:peptidoglycan/LPS O-acetylase OafA/YrhL